MAELAAAKLDALPRLGRDFLRAQVYIEQSMQPRFPHVAVPDLQAAWADILRRAKLVQHHKISREELSVREHMSIVLKHLQGRKFVEFENLFDPTQGTPVLVVTFIALLELAKETLIEITQAEAFAPIYVRLAYTPYAGRATNVPVTIASAEGTKTITLNQREECLVNGVPRSLGRFRFESGKDASVTLSNADANGYVVVDAVQFVPASIADDECHGVRDSGFTPQQSPVTATAADPANEKQNQMAAAAAVAGRLVDIRHLTAGDS